MSETNATTELLPPSERDWALYHAVRVQQWPTRAAAIGFEMSQTRVCQIVQRTAAFIAQSMSVPSKEEEARQLVAGKQLAADRLDFLYGQAMNCFRHSQEAKNGCDKGRRNYGDVRYLHTAARLALIASTLPAPRQLWPGDCHDAPEPNPEPAHAPSSRRPQPAARCNRAETCSAPLAEQAPEPVAEPNTPSAIAEAMMGCVDASRKESGPPAKLAGPVQPTVRDRRRLADEDKKEAKRRAFFQPG